MNNDSTKLSFDSSTDSSTEAASPAEVSLQSGPLSGASSGTTSRRTFLSLTLAGCAAGCAALAGCGSSKEGGTGPVTGMAPMAKATRTGDSWLVEGAGSLAPGAAVQFQAGGEPVLVIGDASGVRAFSGRCTHMGCAVEWRVAAKRFVCPCHNSNFDANGKVISGPAPKPLPAYSAKKQGADALVTVKA